MVPRSVSFALTCAPRSSSTFIAATLPVRDAIMSAVSPRGSALVRIRAGLQEALDDGRVAVQASQRERGEALAVGDLELAPA